MQVISTTPLEKHWVRWSPELYMSMNQCIGSPPVTTRMELPPTLEDKRLLALQEKGFGVFIRVFPSTGESTWRMN